MDNKQRQIPEPQTAGVRYPDINVQLTGRDGNAFAIMGACTRAMRRAGVPSEEVKKFTDECMSGDYDHLLATTMKWLDVS